MRLRVVFALLICCFTACSSGQSTTALPFLTEVITKYPAIALPHTLTLTGSATWIAGKDSEKGTGTLRASSDGSSSVTLSLQAASQTETRAAMGANRSCTWVDSKAITHTTSLPDCLQSVSWFAPLVLANPAENLKTLLQITDGSSVLRQGSSYRLINYQTNALKHPDKLGTLSKGTNVSVLFDPTSLQPASIEYLLHADKDFNTTLRVRVVYSDYRIVSGIPVAFHIDRYVNDSLQLSMLINNASVQ